MVELGRAGCALIRGAQLPSVSSSRALRPYHVAPDNPWSLDQCHDVLIRRLGHGWRCCHNSTTSVFFCILPCRKAAPVASCTLSACCRLLITHVRKCKVRLDVDIMPKRSLHSGQWFASLFFQQSAISSNSALDHSDPRANQFVVVATHTPRRSALSPPWHILHPWWKDCLVLRRLCQSPSAQLCA